MPAPDAPGPGSTPDVPAAEPADGGPTEPADATRSTDAHPSRREPDTEFLAPPQQPDELGRLASYRILRRLGAGGMGVVFEAEDTALDRPVALKVMRGEVAATADARDRFVREAKAAAAVKHDHIVTIYQVGEDRGVPFIALEYLRGTPLDRWLAARPRPPLAQVLRIGREIAAGLAAAHDRGLVHRDIKPANVWLEAPKVRVKILDFGLARPATSADLTREGAVVGTPAYMSPEQARGQRVDARTDLFSLGVVLYRMAAGELPFKGSTAMAVLTALAVDTPTPVRDLNPDVPPPLADLIHRLLSKDPAGRPASAAEVAKELRAIERGLQPAAASAPVVMVAPPAAEPPESLFAGLLDESAAEPLPAPAAGRPGGRAWLAVAVVPGLLLVAGVAAAVYFGRPGPGPSAGKAPPPAPPPSTRPTARATPKDAPQAYGGDYKAAAALHPYVKLDLLFPSGEQLGLAPHAPMPEGPFTIQRIHITAYERPLLRPGLMKELLPIIAELRGLDGLADYDNFVGWTEADVARLAQAPVAANLSELVLTGQNLTPALLDSLKRFPRLRILSCWFTGVDDQLAGRLKELTALEFLSIGFAEHSDLTAAGVASITGLPLKTLTVNVDGPLRRDWERGIGGMISLEKLHVFRATDGTLAEVTRCPRLTSLIVEAPTVTDSGVEQLVKLSKLGSLSFRAVPAGGRMPEAGLRKLAAALPKCEITWEGTRVRAPDPPAP